MGRLEDLYAAAARAGLLAAAEVDGQVVMVDFRAPDEDLLDGLALSTDYTMRFPASVLPELAVGQTVLIGGEQYRIREVRAFGDGSERRASLTLL
jgi:hypothetical protein